MNIFYGSLFSEDVLPSSATLDSAVSLDPTIRMLPKRRSMRILNQPMQAEPGEMSCHEAFKARGTRQAKAIKKKRKNRDQEKSDFSLGA
ncbi:MAG: hypothetical protein SGCHY_004287 [Lobulomycetales sp.]